MLPGEVLTIACPACGGEWALTYSPLATEGVDPTEVHYSPCCGCPDDYEHEAVRQAFARGPARSPALQPKATPYGLEAPEPAWNCFELGGSD